MGCPNESCRKRTINKSLNNANMACYYLYVVQEPQWVTGKQTSSPLFKTHSRKKLAVPVYHRLSTGVSKPTNKSMKCCVFMRGSSVRGALKPMTTLLVLLTGRLSVTRPFSGHTSGGVINNEPVTQKIARRLQPALFVNLAFVSTTFRLFVLTKYWEPVSELHCLILRHSHPRSEVA